MGTEHVDVAVVGAGISGIGAAYRLQTLRPGTSYAVLEAREGTGGTWDLFRYPGVRSDSDMLTLGYPFHPWEDPRTIADGVSILRYVRETAARYGIDRRIRLRTRVVAASWDTASVRWTLTTRTGAPGRPDRTETMTASFLYLCTGYYRHDAGHTPRFPGQEAFGGRVVHPQHWPEDLDVSGRRVVVIGSGATAVSLVPALAEDGAQVTMLQRSPSHILVLPSRDGLAATTRRLLPDGVALRVGRWRNALLTGALYAACRRAPRTAARLIRAQVERALGGALPVDPHFTPSYDPWDQRLCLSPDGDLFAAIRAGHAAVVTDEVASFTPSGLRLASGAELEADVVVTATGLRLEAFGGVALSVDGVPVDPAGTVLYRGVLLSGVPNAAVSIGYANASWTLRADLSARYVCRLLAHMSARGWAAAVPVAPANLETTPLLRLSSGYLRRAPAALPRQGTRRPWTVPPSYLRDAVGMRLADVTAGMRFLSAAEAEVYQNADRGTPPSRQAWDRTTRRRRRW